MQAPLLEHRLSLNELLHAYICQPRQRLLPSNHGRKIRSQTNRPLSPPDRLSQQSPRIRSPPFLPTLGTRGKSQMVIQGSSDSIVHERLARLLEDRIKGSAVALGMVGEAKSYPNKLSFGDKVTLHGHNHSSELMQQYGRTVIEDIRNHCMQQHNRRRTGATRGDRGRRETGKMPTNFHRVTLSGGKTRRRCKRRNTLLKVCIGWSSF